MSEYNDVIVERFARAWASIDGKSAIFDQERGCDYLEEDNTGTFVGYMAEARELLTRANCYVSTSAPTQDKASPVMEVVAWLADLSDGTQFTTPGPHQPTHITTQEGVTVKTLRPLYTTPTSKGEVSEEMRQEALRQLQLRDERDQRVHDIIEELREIILLMPAASRPDGLFQKAQDAVYGMRGRLRLMDDAALIAALTGKGA